MRSIKWLITVPLLAVTLTSCGSKELVRRPPLPPLHQAHRLSVLSIRHWSARGTAASTGVSVRVPLA